MVNLTEVIAPSFYEAFWDAWEEKYTHNWHKGGRGSTKSSFIGVMIPLKMMDDAEKGIMSNALIIRRVKDTLRESVLEQIIWGIEKLGASEKWEVTYSPMRVTYLPTGQQIRFKGADNPAKVKSTKVAKGWIKYIWYEEVDEFEGMNKIRSFNQSLMRGGPKFQVFYSFNPPKSQRSWVNREVLEERNDKRCYSTTFETVPVEWLGEQFVIEAEHLKKQNYDKYRHEYLGEVVGTGGEVFLNVTQRRISDEEIEAFDRIKRGLDFGYGADPLAYAVCHYDKTRKRLYIFHELYKRALSNSRAVESILQENIYNSRVTGDSAEPRTINEFKTLGLNIKGAKKGQDSVHYGIKFLSEEIEQIIIDPTRCPHGAKELVEYELEKDKDGEYKGEYPDKNNHFIDALRYALEQEMIQWRGLSVLKKRR